MPSMGCHQLLLWDGITHKHLGQYEEARQTFAQAGALQPRPGLLAGRRLEFLTYSAEAAVGLRDVDRCMLSLETAGKDSLQLGHEQRYAEACQVYKLARAVWPREGKVVKLEESSLIDHLLLTLYNQMRRSDDRDTTWQENSANSRTTLAWSAHPLASPNDGRRSKGLCLGAR
ncbi:MAG: hypothetical protein JO202_12435 [Ktedonobacteraceae bacterium]|nr:hypothetical protein [Ktedonobacteraceae bacterium]